jgi:hypothetical protein
VDFVLAAVVRNSDAIDGVWGAAWLDKAPDFWGFSTMMYILGC